MIRKLYMVKHMLRCSCELATGGLVEENVQLNRKSSPDAAFTGFLLEWLMRFFTQ